MKNKWINIKIPPSIGGEYLVVWNLDDGEYPVVTSMEYEFHLKKWVDRKGNLSDMTPELLYWKELPEPPKGIPTVIWNNMDGVYGHCKHGENMAVCYECNTIMKS